MGRRSGPDVVADPRQKIEAAARNKSGAPAVHLGMRLILSALLLLSCASAQVPREPAPGQPAVTIMTWNVNFGLRGDALSRAIIAEAQADVVVLQETTPAWEKSLAPLAAQYPHQRWFHVVDGAGGMAILSRRPFVAEPVPPGPGWFDAVQVRLETPAGPVEALAVHLRPPVSDTGSFVSGHFKTPKIRVGELKHHARYLKGDAPLVVLGDFNEDENGAAIAWISKTKGLSNALMAFAPGADTWRWPTRLWTFEETLDHILYDRRLDCLNARVIKAGRSDHFPVVATFVRR